MEDPDPKDLQDCAVLRLRAAVTALRKFVDDVSLEISDQVNIIKVAKWNESESTLKEVIAQYTQLLADLLVKGDTLLTNFITKNSLLEKLEYLILKFEFSDSDQHSKVVSLRNRLVGEALPYHGRFRKLRVKLQNLLSCLLSTQAPVATADPTVVSHARKKYSFLKPSMVHGDRDEKYLTKLINEARIWLNKTITEEERKEEGMIYASLRSVLDSD